MASVNSGLPTLYTVDGILHTFQKTLPNNVYWNKLASHVEKILSETDDLDEYEHIKNIALVAAYIFMMEEKRMNLSANVVNSIGNKVYVVSWMYELHKNKYTAAKVKSFLKDNLKNDADIYDYLQILDRVSYGKEVESKSNITPENNWDEALGKDGYIVRNIVSDARNIYELSDHGMNRFMGDAMSKFKKEYGETNVPKEYLWNLLRAHTIFKMAKIKEGFVRTNIGRRLAEGAHDQYMQSLEKFRKSGSP